MPLAFDCDRAGFPLLWIEPLGAHLHWLPVTKVQFEVFLCDTDEPGFDAAWYDRLLALNPRLSAADLQHRNYWRGLLTGVLPGEAQRFAAWCGEEYALPTLEQWLTAYRTVSALPALPRDAIDRLPGLSERGRLLVQALDSAAAGVEQGRGRPRTLAEQMLMRQGALEWVEETVGSGSWAALGELPSSFRKMIASPEIPVIPPQAATVRCEIFGFRLLRRTA